MKLLPTPCSSRARAGFTLAEVMIAMGIVASVMVALLGMIPLGVRSVREATNLTLNGRIAQEVISNIQQANWKDVEKSFDGKTLYFDYEGFLIRPGLSQQGTVPTFEATIRVVPDAITIGTTEYDKSTLRKILVDVEFTPDGRKIPPKLSDRNQDPNKSTYVFYVANQNKLQ